jgi:outer membrane protein OmpA-like peptidoglycan-associated protein
MPSAAGEAKVEGKKTNVEIDAKFQGLEDSSKFGLEYLTYVLWAISPQGRPVNLGELALDHGRGHIKTFTDMQTFGMIVTAEPYAAVSQPGNTVILENVVVAAGEDITAKYELLGSGTYSSVNTHIQDAIFGIDPNTPRELFEARNAVRIAHLMAADRFAPTIIAKADEQLRQAETAYRSKQDKRTIEAADKKAADDRAAKARADAEAQARARAEADSARAQAEKAKAEALQAAQEAARQKQEAEQAKAEAVAQQQALAAEADKARQAAAQSEQARQQAEKEKQDLRARLLQQLNTVLATRDSARGLIANMSDVLFKSGSSELLAGARERLAKVSGIVLAYPTLKLSVEGHTDSIGSDDYNQQLSEKRAASVREYLVQQGIASDSIVATGFGKTSPVATNDTPEGRQQNRRVELVLSGDAIGDLNAGAGSSSETASRQ